MKKGSKRLLDDITKKSMEKKQGKTKEDDKVDTSIKTLQYLIILLNTGLDDEE